MPRPRLHTTDAILDAARDLVVEQGAHAATTTAIAKASGAPSGSLYHRFGSRDALLTQVWMRAARRSQDAVVAAVEGEEDPVEAVVAGALAFFDFCDEHAADARLLVALRREDLAKSELPPELIEELDTLNTRIQGALVELTRRVYGSRSRDAVDRVVFAVVDLPYAAGRRFLLARREIPAARRRQVEGAVRAALAA